MEKPLPCFKGYSPRSLLSLLDLRFETGYPVGDPTLRVEDIGPVAFARAWLCYVFHSFLHPVQPCAVCFAGSLLRCESKCRGRNLCFCVPWQVTTASDSTVTAWYNCGCRWISCTFFWQIALSHQLCLVFCWGSGCNIWCGRVTQCSRSSVEIQMSTRSSQISSEQTWTSRASLGQVCGKMGKDIQLRQVSTMFPCFTICRPCLYPGDGMHKASGLVKFEGNDKKNLLMVQQIQNGQNVEALTWWSTLSNSGRIQVEVHRGIHSIVLRNHRYAEPIC